MRRSSSLMFVVVAALLSTAMTTFAAASEKIRYVAPDPSVGLSPKNEVYLIGVVSTVLVVIATYMAVKSMTDINYDDDTLLMVEVPESDQHEEE